MNAPFPSERPPAVAWLGYGGLIPFVVPALCVVLTPGNTAFWLQALAAYGAAILSFVGALHWAFAMLLPGLTPSHRRYSYVWSTIPALAAWVALLLPTVPGLLLLIGGLVAHYAHDLKLVKAAPLPDWYLPLRTQLTIGAGLSLATAMLTVLSKPGA